MRANNSDDGIKGIEEQLKELLKKAQFAFVGGTTTETARGEETSREQPPPAAPDRLKAIREFNLKPRDIRDYLDRFVVKQDEAKKVLSVAICDHYNHVRRCLENPALREEEYTKQNIILLGPTGVGKTYLVRCIAKLIGVPFVKADATKFSETGYVGHDTEDLVRDLVKAADGDVELAQYGIIYLDEIDKIASQGTIVGRDVSGRGVQINLLKLMEETEVPQFSQTDLLGQVQAIMDMQRGRPPARRTINTRHILFIVSGAFDKLADHVRRRLRATQIGFGAEVEKERTESDWLRLAETRDFIEYGFEAEFIGRLPVRVVCDRLTAEDLELIMRQSEGNILAQYKTDFQGYGIDFQVTPEAIKKIAELAEKEQTGARGLMTVLERICRDFKFELPSTALKSFVLDAATVDDPRATLVKLLKEKEIARRDLLAADVLKFAEKFEQDHGLKLVFDDDALEAIVSQCLASNRGALETCRRLFHDFEYGLKLIARNTGRTSFRVTIAVVNDPAGELSRWIAQSFVKE